jgi:hypothetical protein
MQSLFKDAFTEPFARLSQEFAHVLPGLVSVCLILIAGGLLAALARFLVYHLLRVFHFDRLAARSGLAGLIEHARVFRSPSDFAARMVQGFLWLVIILAALGAIQSPLADTLLARFVNFVPELVAAVLILLLGNFVSKFLARSALLAAVNAQWATARIVAGGVRILVMLMAVAMALEELRIGRSVLLVSFAIVFAGFVIAASIAFGLGGRDIARRWMETKIQKTLPEDDQLFHHL